MAKQLAALAELVANAARYRDPPTLAVFSSFVTIAEELSGRPLEVSSDDVDAAVALSRDFAVRVEAFRTHVKNYEDLKSTIPRWFPREWKDSPESAEIIKLTSLAEQIFERLKIDNGLTIADVDNLLNAIADCIAALEKMREKAEGTAEESRRRSGRHKDRAGWLDDALKAFGFNSGDRPDCGALTKAYRMFMRRNHPDMFEGESYSDADRASQEEKTKKANEDYPRLRAHFGC